MKKSGKINTNASGMFPKVAGIKRSMFRAGQQVTATPNVSNSPTFFYSPELTPDAWLLPKSRAEILRWCRIFFNLDPYVSSIIEMHSRYPFSKFHFNHKDQSVKDFYNKAIFGSDFDWLDFIYQASLSYWKYGEFCLAGDTKIPLLNGKEYTIKELYDSKMENFDVYSIDKNNNKVIGKCSKVVCNGKRDDILKIYLKSGNIFKCTSDHKILTHNGIYKEARYLTGTDKLIKINAKDFDSIICIEKEKSELVYDLVNVAPENNFAISAGVYVHNCAWGNWNTRTKRWDGFILLDPDIVDFDVDPFTGNSTIAMKPTIEVKKMVADSLMQGRNDIPETVVDCVLNNKKIPLDGVGIPVDNQDGYDYEPPKVSIFARKTDPGNLRGTPVIQRLMKILIYQDKIRLAQLAIADRHHLPMELWTVGSWTGDEKTSVLPTETDLQNVRDMIQQSTQNAPFSIVYGPLLKYEALGVSGKLLSVYEDLGYVENQILVGLGVNKNLILSEGSTFGAGKTIALHRLIMEYQAIRDLFTSWFTRYVLKPLAVANNLVDINGEYQIPEIIWEKSLSPEQDKEELDLYFKLWKEGLISTKTLFRKLPDDIIYKEEMENLVAEKNTAYDKGGARLSKSPSISTDTSNTSLTKPTESLDIKKNVSDILKGPNDGTVSEIPERPVSEPAPTPSTETPAETNIPPAAPETAI